MDTNEDWAEKKEQEKDDRYSSHLGLINFLSRRGKSGWKATHKKVYRLYSEGWQSGGRLPNGLQTEDKRRTLSTGPRSNAL